MSHALSNNLLNRISHQVKYFESPQDALNKIINKTIIPYQVEFQPGRIKGKKICWLECSYCYGGSSSNSDEKLTPDRYVDLIGEVAKGPKNINGVKKVIYAGYATDPLNYEYIDDLVDESKKFNQIIGIHSKLIKISDRLIDILTDNKIQKTSYITISLDAGDNESYNKTHNLGIKSKIYDRVLNNVEKLVQNKKQNSSDIDISINYLVTLFNNESSLVEKAINDLVSIGVNSLRFSFPQLPRGMDSNNGFIIPNKAEVNAIYNNLINLISKYNGQNGTSVVLNDFDNENNISDFRTMPCFARFIYPAVAYDGYLSHCSQSGAIHFRDMSLGNLQNNNFWDLFYNYDEKNIKSFLSKDFVKMKKNDCRCDRKEHIVNSSFKNII